MIMKVRARSARNGSKKSASDGSFRKSLEKRLNRLEVVMSPSLELGESEQTFALPRELSRMPSSAITDMMALCAGQRAYLLGQLALIEVDMMKSMKQMTRQKALLIRRSSDVAKWKIEDEVVPLDSEYATYEDAYDESNALYKLLDSAQQGVYDKHQVLSRELTRRGQEAQIT